MILTIIISTIIWLLHTVLNSYVQSYYYSLFPSEKKHPNLHQVYVMIRAIILALILWNLWYDLGWMLTGIYGLCLCCIYSFFHNGVYYAMRHKIDKEVYPKGFWDASTTSQATIELGIGMRTAIAIVGFVGIYLITRSI